MNRVLNNLFYTLKPFIPRRLQITLRRIIAQYKIKKYAHIWPIDPNSATPPKDWTGWPEGKQFALVLSHDVDTRIGQDRVWKLAELEKMLGMRSAFNFVPERYKNHKSIKEALKTNGFEINVHGLIHDGKLFKNKTIFDQRSEKIKRYLQEWGSTGFTSPSMHHNPTWLHALNITHSISTFDTDPFEPQSDAVETIFPFWVPNEKGQDGYVELPYTIPQDHLLFIILRERNIDIWKRKLDWIAEKGGMVLLNTHSDYMKINDSKVGREEYPIGYYIELLSYVKSAHTGQFWHATPFEIADYWKQHMVDHIHVSQEFQMNN